MQIKLWENEIPYFDAGADTPNYMETYFIETSRSNPLPCIVVLPGGGYACQTAMFAKLQALKGEFCDDVSIDKFTF